MTKEAIDSMNHAWYKLPRNWPTRVSQFVSTFARIFWGDWLQTMRANNAVIKFVVGLCCLWISCFYRDTRRIIWESFWHQSCHSNSVIFPNASCSFIALFARYGTLRRSLLSLASSTSNNFVAWHDWESISCFTTRQYDHLPSYVFGFLNFLARCL